MKKTGIDRLISAALNSKKGFNFLIRNEAAFKQELLLTVILAPIAFLIGSNLLESLFLISTLILVLITEILNTAIEATVDRIGTEQHELSGLAKDLGSAAVLLSVTFASFVWLLMLIKTFL